MKISYINNVFNMPLKNNYKEQNNSYDYNTLRVVKNPIKSDVVSFSGKNYDFDSILNPTNHCAYCGCKVYSEQQIDNIAKEILASKADRLEGKIKSVLEKFEEAKHSQELALAKKQENEKEISFFKSLLDIASKKSWLKGESIFKEVYNIDREKALEILIKNLRPLSRTIDHISPQNLEQKNNNVDINLVEACYTCNHDLKQGSSFEEFYTMFPDIKYNMPSEKFKFAASNLLNNSEDNIAQRLSATNLLKFIERLFHQKTEITNSLNSVNYRIKCCSDSISLTVDSCREEIKNKEAEIEQLSKTLEQLYNDSEYMAIVKRNELSSAISSCDNKISSLRDDKNSASNSINNLRSEIVPKSSRKKKKSSKPFKELSEEAKKQKEAEIEQLKIKIKEIESKINELEEEKSLRELELEELNSKFPTVQMLEIKKHDIDVIINAYSSLSSKRIEQKRLNSLMDEINAKINDLNNKILLCHTTSFDSETLNEPEKEIYLRYIDLKTALKYIEEHVNQGAVKGVINSVAKIGIEQELADLSNNSIVKDFESAELYKSLKAELAVLEKQKNNVQNQINNNESQINATSSIVSKMPLEEAKKKYAQYQEDVRRIIEKENQLKLPSIIESIKSEIMLIESTITELLNKQKKINKVI